MISLSPTRRWFAGIAGIAVLPVLLASTACLGLPESVSAANRPDVTAAPPAPAVAKASPRGSAGASPSRPPSRKPASGAHAVRTREVVAALRVPSRWTTVRDPGTGLRFELPGKVQVERGSGKVSYTAVLGSGAFTSVTFSHAARLGTHREAQRTWDGIVAALSAQGGTAGRVEDREPGRLRHVASTGGTILFHPRGDTATRVWRVDSAPMGAVTIVVQTIADQPAGTNAVRREVRALQDQITARIQLP